MRCKSCGIDHDESAFYASNKSRCKECVRESVAKHRLANLERIRQYDRMRASQPHRMAKNVAITAAWRVAHPKRRAAQVAVGNALRDGRLAKLPCMVCGADAEAHHPDYDQPLDVVWLCPPHHKQAHALARKLDKEAA